MLIRKEKEKLITLFELGLSTEEVCTVTGYELDELQEICTEDESIMSARILGVKNSNIKVIESLLKSATGYFSKDVEQETRYGRDGKTVIYKGKKITTKEIAPNIQSIKFWLENKDSSWKADLKEVEGRMNIRIKVNGKDIIVQKNDEE